MPDNNRFTRLLQTARGQHEAELDKPEPEKMRKAPLEAKPRAEMKGRGRPATGKRSDPDYESTTVFLRRNTKLAAAKKLIGDREQDLSDVLETLLSGWVGKHP